MYRYVSEFYKNNDNGSLYNLLYPYSTTSHYTLGGSYIFSNSFSADCALVYATDTNQYSNVDGSGDNIKIESNPLSFSLGLNYKF